MNPFYDAHETSLSTLSEHDWSVLRNTVARGVDYFVGKLGRRWQIILPAFSTFPLYRTKTAAYEACSNLVIAESRWRAYQQWESEHA